MSDQGNKDFHTIILTLLGVAALVIFFRFFSDEFSAGTAKQHVSSVVTQVERGKRISRSCTACHDLTSARRTTLIGPPLWGIINNPTGTAKGYKYSKAHMEAVEAGLVWTEENLDSYLTNPKAFIPGNRMAFAGIKVDEERWALIEYLKTLQDKSDLDSYEHPLIDHAQFSGNGNTGSISYKVRVKRGRIVAEKCGACHDLTKRKRNIVGPPLFGIVGRPSGGVVSFKYSKGFKKKASEGLVWTIKNLDTYLTNPKEFIPGTKMLFSGVSNPKQRENLLTYLRTLK
ncbi:MAG: cytochrome c family protein [Magnetococcales bacterium]|nr:cytochrome c family protein [Magnetococcales bacterium]